jgi:hypothetical protein
LKRIRVGLLIDDGAVRSAIEFALGVEGFEAVELAKTCASVLDDLVGFTAIVLDVGNASFEAVSQLQSSGFSGKRVIVLATAPSLAVRRLCDKLGAGIIEKPLLCNELIAAVGRMHPIEVARS